MNGRFSTRLMAGRKSIGVEWIFKLFLAFWLLYNEQRFCSDHLGERKLESETGFSPLVLINPIGMQRVATAARARIIERLPEIVAAEEPFEAATCSPLPSRVTG